MLVSGVQKYTSFQPEIQQRFAGNLHNNACFIVQAMCKSDTWFYVFADGFFDLVLLKNSLVNLELPKASVVFMVSSSGPAARIVSDTKVVLC